MKKYNRSEIMSRAWATHKRFPNVPFKKCLLNIWAAVKREHEKISPQQFNMLLNRMKPICIQATKEHYHLLNSRHGRQVMKRDDQDETKQMISSGEIFLNDIVHPRQLSKNYMFRKFNQKNTFRNRIINPDNCVRINIDEFLSEKACEI